MRVVAGLACAAAAFGAAIVVRALVHPTPVADFDAARLVVGTLSVPFAEIDDARLLPAAGRGAKRSASSGGDFGTILRIGKAKTSSSRAVLAAVPVPGAGRGRVSDLRRAALLVVLGRSSIRMPTDRHDPTGRFAQYNFPDNLDKERAMALVLGDRSGGEPTPQHPDP